MKSSSVTVEDIEFQGGMVLGAFKWPIGRLTRGSLLYWFVAGSIGFAFADWYFLNRLDLMLNFGFRFNALRDIAHAPIWRVVLEVLFDVALLIAAISRLHDISRSGWWLSGLIIIPICVALGASSSLVLVALIAWSSLLFWPGTIGPNQYGPDPRGWQSREHFEAQERELARPQAKP